MKCPKCGYPHATPPKCRACGAEITEEMVTEAGTPIITEEPSVKRGSRRRSRG